MTSRAQAIVEKYDALVAQGALERDASQRAAVEKLQALADALAGRGPRNAGLRQALLAKLRRRTPRQRGLYLWGQVGRGKTFLMNLFFSELSVEKKRRAHFHAFMADVHERLHRLRRNPPGGDADPLTCVAQEIAQEARVLCFDEFAVNDIADATILARLFSSLLASGVVVVATSNVEPSRLYEGGRNRDLFLPFIALLQERMDVVRLESSSDYRQRRGDLGKVYFTPADSRAKASIDTLFATLADGAAETPATIEVKRRRIEIPQAAGRVARLSFSALCDQALSATDYLALAKKFDAVIVENVPTLAPEQRNEARRFITLVDVLYDARVLLIVSAAAEPCELYQAAFGAEAREFERAASRLIEMRGKDYVQARAPLMASTYTP
ncbi:cell division protein ZapE [Methylocystis sp.]|uniref:cell division protein ZapE n=1 Tax=Methylocystis sp. TaxID=1911079 RepID=UPI0025E66370|nr:cell division protein ZapE [Methylocystis sp.]